MVSKEFFVVARESRSIVVKQKYCSIVGSIVGWVEERNPTTLTITPLILGLKLFYLMPLGILLQPNLQKLQDLRNWHIGRVCQISRIFMGYNEIRPLAELILC
jgi:hypothetical protein